MNSALNRLNLVAMYAIFALIILSLCANIPLLWHQPTPHVGIHNIQVLTYSKASYPSPYSHIFMHTLPRSSALLLKFDLDLDMRSCVHWGVKQLMIWLVVEYTTKSPLATTDEIYTKNRVVLWDTIIPYDEMEADGNIFIEGLEAKYPLSELGGQIDFTQPIKFAIQWEITPILGFFSVYSGTHTLQNVDITKQIGSTVKISGN